MKQTVKNLLFVLLALAAFSPFPSFSDESCPLDIKTLSSDVTEITLGDLGSKVESGGRILKLKITGPFDTAEWTWVSFQKGPAKISAIVDRKGTSGTFGEVIAVQGKGGDTNWAIFKSNDPFVIPNSGRAYFMINKSLSCVNTTLREWTVTVQKVFGESFAEQTTVKGSEAKQAYSELGLK